jgi:hypothetical protein
MCSSAGLAFLVAVGAQLLADSRHRRFLIALVVPTAVYAVWFLATDLGRPGNGGITGDFLQGATGWGYVVSVVGFVMTGVAASATGLAGSVGILSVAVAAVFAYFVARDMLQKLEAWQVGLTLGFIFFFALTATGRVQYGVDLAKESRYVYVGVVFLLPLVAHALRAIPWRGWWRSALLALFALCTLGNLIRLSDVPPGMTYFMHIQEAELQTVEVFRGAPDMAIDRYVDNTVVSSMYASTYLAAIDELGSPVPSMSLDGLRNVPHLAVDRVMRNLFGPSIRVASDSARPTTGLQCRNVDSTSGAAIDLGVPAGQSLMLRSSRDGFASIYLGFLDPPTGEAVQEVKLQAATPVWVRLPDAGKAIKWQLQIKTGAAGTVEVCANPN